MPRMILIAAVLSLLVSMPACDGGAQETDEPSYERVLPPMADLPPSVVEGERQAVDIEPFRAAVDENPDDPGARLIYLSELRRAGEPMEAIEQARIIAGIEGDVLYKSVAYQNIAEIVLDELPSDYPGREELVREAMDGLWIALGYEPESVPAHLALGRLALEAGDDDKALHHLSIALTVTEIGYELRMRMAEICIRRGDGEKARAHLEVARRLAEEAEDRRALRMIRRMLSGLS